MSHEEYIASCSLDQLSCLVDMANRRIQEIQDAEKVVLWEVSDDLIVWKYFMEKDHAAAVALVAKLVTTESVPDENNLWEIKKRRVSVELLGDYDIWKYNE